MTPTRRSSVLPPLVIIGGLFFIFGFVTWLNGTLIPFLKLACSLSNSEALLVTFAFYIAYVVLALPASLILERTGFRNGMALGLLVMAAGALVFVPAAHSRSFGLFLGGLFVQGAGLALLQTAANPYVSIIGPIESAARRIILMGICNKAAGIIAPLVLSAIVLRGASALETQLAGALDVSQREALLQELANRVIAPYLVWAGVLVVFAVLVRQSGLPEIELRSANKTADATSLEQPSIWQFPHLWLGVLAIFCCVGVEVIAGDTIGQYGQHWGISLDVAKNLTSVTLGAMLLGYTIGLATIPRYLSQQAALRLCALLGTALTLGVVLTHGYVSVLLVALLGLANSLLWPAIFPLSIRGLGQRTELGSALLIMGIGGGAVLPYVWGRLGEQVGPQGAYCLLIACYLYLLYFAWRGHAVPARRQPVALEAVPMA